MSARRFALADIVPTPWKNGGGATREIACWPPGTGLDSFDWRISVATIAADGAFSVFAGIDRSITLLSGDGVRLHGEHGTHRGKGVVGGKTLKPSAASFSNHSCN